jgi:putative acetyltransferase
MSGAAQALRRLTLDEMDRAAVILRRALDDRLPWLAGRYSPAEDRAFLRGRVFAASEVWGAGGAEISGFIALRNDWVEQLHVLPQDQGRGIGGALLRHAQARRAALRLWTFQRNLPARGFYARHGFLLVEETDGSRNEEGEPDALYRWQRAADGPLPH